jgi:hypothetical protein
MSVSMCLEHVVDKNNCFAKLSAEGHGITLPVLDQVPTTSHLVKTVAKFAKDKEG